MLYFVLMRGWRLVAALSTCAVLVLLGRADAAPREYLVAPPPSWIDRVAPDLDAKVPDRQVSDGTYELLFDQQHFADAHGSEHWIHFAQKILSATGVANAAEVEIEFDPAFETLTLHYFRIHRDGKTIDALRGAEVRVTNAERDLERRILDGSKQAMVILEDLRPGDVLEVAYTIAGENPALAGRFGEVANLGSRYPVAHIHGRVLWKRERPLHTRVHGVADPPVERQLPDGREIVWDDHDVPGVDLEDDVPSWYYPWPYLEISDFASWSDVVAATLPLYQVPSPLARSVQEVIDRMAREHSSPEARALAAIRFVQDEVRYLGLEMGNHSYEPHQPAQVLSRRLGDCKDKVNLLVTLLRGLGIEAYPALVHTENRRTLDTTLPSPFAFDHVVVRAVVNGKIRWIDATSSEQGGKLEELQFPDYERALVVRPETTGLEVIDRPALATPEVFVDEEIDVRDPSGIARIDVTTRYLGSAADETRNELASKARDDLSRQYLGFYASEFPQVKVSHPIEVTDDREGNVVTVLEHYRARGLFSEGKRTFSAHEVRRRLPAQDAARDEAPLAVWYPVHLQHTVRVRLPAPPVAVPAPRALGNAAAKLWFVASAEGTTLILQWAYQTLSGAVPSWEVESFLDLTSDMDGLLDVEVALPPPVLATMDRADAEDALAKRSGGWGGIGVLTLVAGMLGGVAVVVVFERYRRARVALRYQHLPGDAAASAVVVPAIDRIDWRRVARCRCGATLVAPRDAGVEEVAYDGRVLYVVQGACSACGGSASRYFDVRA